MNAEVRSPAAQSPPPIDPVNETVVSIQQAADHYGISRAKAWRLVLKGDVASFKLGGNRKSTLEAFARACTING